MLPAPVPCRRVCLSWSVLFLVFLALILFSCTSAPDETNRTESNRSGDELIRGLRPRDGQAVFLGVSPRLHNRDNEYDQALLHAAEQASRYTRIAARYQLVTQRGGGSVGHIDEISADWDHHLADQLLETMSVLDSVQDSSGTFLLATSPRIPPAPPVVIPETHHQDEPPWISRPPEIPGFIVTVGITRRSRRIRDSLDTADQDALQEILLQAGSTVRMIQDRRDVDRVGTMETTTAAQNAEATLQQFLVLARHASADGTYFYSLVAAREE